MIAMMWGYDWGWGAWLAMSVMMLLVWGLIIAGIVALVRYLGGTRQGGHGHGGQTSNGSGQASAEELLAERFARGEIDAEEYTSRRELLRPAR